MFQSMAMGGDMVRHSYTDREHQLICSTKG